MTSTKHGGTRWYRTKQQHHAGRRAVILSVALLMILSACARTGGSSTTTSTTQQQPSTTAVPTTAPALTKVTMQLGWIASNNQLGEIVAMQKGFYADEGIELQIVPGGPNIDGVAIVASGKADIGQLSSSPSLMLAVAHNIPVKAFAAVAQQHPFTYFSMPDTPLSSPQDLAGKVVGTQPTAMILLDALLAKNGMKRSDLADVVPIGSDITPLLTGQVGVWTGWVTNTSQLEQLPKGYHQLRLWDAGVQLYALVEYARDDFLADNPELVEGFLRASAKGWQYARDHTDEAVDMLIKEYPNLNPKAEANGARVILGFVFTDASQQGGWGTMDPQIWSNQLHLWDQLGQFKDAKVPKLDEVMTTKYLDATATARRG